MRRKVFFFIIIGAVCLFASLQLLIFPHTERNGFVRISPDGEDCFNWDYLLYVPEQVTSAHILVIPNNTGDVDDDIQVHLKAAINLMQWRKHDADTLGTVLLIPVFPRPLAIGHVYTHALDRDCLLIDQKKLKRLDLQLIAMIDDARQALSDGGLELSEQVLLYGFSASGMFANRFTILHPDRVKAAVIGSPGGWPIAPLEQYLGKTLPYPIGVADIIELTGQKLDLAAFQRVPQLFLLGDQDTNDASETCYFEGGQELRANDFGLTPAERWQVAQSIYENCGVDALFYLYPGVGHEVTDEMQGDMIQFLLQYAS